MSDEIRIWMERLEARVSDLEQEKEELADDFADLCDELGRDVNRVRIYKKYQRVLHELLIRAFTLEGEGQLRHQSVRPGRRGKSITLEYNAPVAARVALYYILRLTVPDMASVRRLKADYGVKVYNEPLTDEMTRLLLIAPYRVAYQQVIAELKNLGLMDRDVNAEPSYYRLKKAAENCPAVVKTGRPSELIED